MSKNLPLKFNPDPFLRQKSKPVELSFLESDNFKKFVPLFIEALHEDQGIGLAAPQVGRHWRVITVQVKDSAEIIINPEITKFSFSKDLFEEGCLSVPGVFGYVKRPTGIHVRGLSMNGKPLDFDAEGLYARVIQHEVDHLNGILFIDKVTEFTSVPDNATAL